MLYTWGDNFIIEFKALKISLSSNLILSSDDGALYIRPKLSTDISVKTPLLFVWGKLAINIFRLLLTNGMLNTIVLSFFITIAGSAYNPVVFGGVVDR